MTQEKKCQELIQDCLKGRIEQINECNQECECEEDCICEEDREDFFDNVLSVGTFTVHRVLLSWGGPSDFFDIKVQNGEIVQIDYVRQDWFDGARVELEGNDFDTVAAQFSYLEEM